MFTRKENGAEVEITIVDKPINGAREDADGVYRVENGAETEVWANTKRLDLIEKTVSTGSVSSPDAWGGSTSMTSLNDGGVVTYAADGDFYDPTFSCSYGGWFFYEASDGGRFAAAGDLYAYGVKADGTVESVLIASGINTTGAAGTPSVSYTFTGGAYKKIGFRFDWNNWNVPAASIPIYSFSISDILIDNQKYITDSADDFDYGDT